MATFVFELPGWLAGWLALFKTDRADLRQPTVSLPFSHRLLSFFSLHPPPSIRNYFPFLFFFFLRTLALSSPTLSLSLALARSPMPLMPSKRRRSAQKQFILFISSSFLRRHKDEDEDVDVDFFIRRSPPRSITNESERTHLDAMLFEKIILSADHPIPNSSLQSTLTKRKSSNQNHQASIAHLA